MAGTVARANHTYTYYPVWIFIIPLYLQSGGAIYQVPSDGSALLEDRSFYRCRVDLRMLLSSAKRWAAWTIASVMRLSVFTSTFRMSSPGLW